MINKISVPPLNLKINDQKTIVSQFIKSGDSIKCSTKIELSTNYSENQPLKYLGFEFDGEKVHLKEASLAKFYRDMKYTVQARAKKSKQAQRYNKKHPRRKPKDTKLHLSKTYSRFTHLGKNKGNGNYLRYVDRSAKEMYPTLLNIKNPIKKQLYGAWSIFSKTIGKYKATTSTPTPSSGCHQ